MSFISDISDIFISDTDPESQVVSEKITKEELLEYLPQKWKTLIPSITLRSYWDTIIKGINASIKKSYYAMPALNNIFNSLKFPGTSNFRVLIIGQDPYPTPGMSTGYAFSVMSGKRISKSLENMFKEIDREYGSNMYDDLKFDGDLTSWMKQGVMLLNTCLTIGTHNTSHKGIGWEQFTKEIIGYLDKHFTFVTLALGNPAQAMAENIVNNKKLIVKTGHPSPLNTVHPFYGCGCFSKCNQLLRNEKLLPIKWTI